jgi:tripeptide aminopeptidase
MKEALERTFRDLVVLDSPSKSEGLVSNYIQERLTKLGISIKTDSIGNVIGFIPGEGEPILLNAHMDGVPPSLGHTPVKEGDTLRSDGKTNLRADDVAGISIILEATQSIVEGKKSHPPMVLAFTVQEEIGLFGAKALDVSEYGVNQGIVFDNAFEPGIVVSKGSCYVAFDVEIKGKETHPGKDLSQGVNAVQVLLDTGIKTGEADEGKTRINIGSISGGRARNVVPGNVKVQGEIRSFLAGGKLKRRVTEIQSAFTSAGKAYGAEIVFSDKQLAVAYEVSEDEPLLTKYRGVVEKRGGEFKTQETFVASDANVLRGEKGLKVFVISTGVKNEHSIEETVDLSDMEQLTNDLMLLLEFTSAKGKG